MSTLHAKQQKIALIFGVTGQDGSYLSELLLKKNYIVHGIKRRSSSLNTQRIDHLYDHKNFHLHYGDLTDATNVTRLINFIKPDEIYNLGAQSHVQVSFELPEYTAHVDGIGVLHILEGVRSAGLENKTKIYQASTSELYGEVQTIPQNEQTPFYPCSPYGVAKLYGFWIGKNYRESYKMFICNGILFNHESPQRGETFVTQKIVRAAVRIKYGLQKELFLGNLESLRDWGHAKDYVYAMWLMLQQTFADDYVVATGTMHSVREFVEKVFSYLELPITWQGSEINEVGIIPINTVAIRIDERYFRPREVNLLCGDATKAYTQLEWQPKISFDELVKEMVESEKRKIKQHIKKD
jgi:GDPmannose 4,6-dehydratase